MLRGTYGIMDCAGIYSGKEVVWKEARHGNTYTTKLVSACGQVGLLPTVLGAASTDAHQGSTTTAPSGPAMAPYGTKFNPPRGGTGQGAAPWTNPWTGAQSEQTPAPTMLQIETPLLTQDQRATLH